MAYAPLVTGLLLFVLVLGLHLLIWRLFRPVKDVLLLFALFAFPPLLLATLFLLFPVQSASITDLRALAEVLGALLCYGALSAAYIMTYPALQARCPSLRMVLLINRAGKSGLGIEELSASFDTADLVTDRLDDLVSAGLVVKSVVSGQGAPYSVTTRGALLLRPFTCFRRFLGLAPGEG